MSGLRTIRRAIRRTSRRARRAKRRFSARTLPHDLSTAFPSSGPTRLDPADHAYATAWVGLEAIEPRVLLSAAPWPLEDTELLVQPEGAEAAILAAVLDDGTGTVLPAWEGLPGPIAGGGSETTQEISVPETLKIKNPAVGAIHAVLAHPTDPDVIWVGTVNGGIWKTSNATDSAGTGVVWAPQTDHLGPLSIGAMAFVGGPSGPATEIVAGIGGYSSLTPGSPLRGVLHFTPPVSGPEELGWTLLPSSGLINEVEAGNNEDERNPRISGIATNGDGTVIIVSVVDGSEIGQPESPFPGIYRSTDGGLSFTSMTLPNGFNDSVTDLAQAPNDVNVLFAAVIPDPTGALKDGVPARGGILRLTPNWAIFTVATSAVGFDDVTGTESTGLQGAINGHVPGAFPFPVISEVLYDPAGAADDGKYFIELFGPDGFSLDGYSIKVIDGNDGATIELDLTGSVIPADGVFVIADELDASPGTTLVNNADLIAQLALPGRPASIQLLNDDVAVDAIAYGSFGSLLKLSDGKSKHYRGEGGEKNTVPDAPEGKSVARRQASVDRNRNNVDFVTQTPTPGIVSTNPVKISELLWDAGDIDNGNLFIELTGPPGLDLTGYEVRAQEEGSAEVLVAQLVGMLPEDRILVPGDGIFVLADQTAPMVTNYPAEIWDLTADFDGPLPNGPATLVLYDMAGVEVDAVEYFKFNAAISEENPPRSLQRSLANEDTDDTSGDFFTVSPTFIGSPGLAIFAGAVNIELSIFSTVSDPNRVWVGVVDSEGGNDVSVFYSEASGEIYTETRESPATNSIGQGSTHFSIAASPTDRDVVFVGGDTDDSFHGVLFRADVGDDSDGKWRDLFGSTTKRTRPHSDSREIVFSAPDTNGEQFMIEVDDGGIFRLNDPHETNTVDTNTKWFSLNGDLQITEISNIAYDYVADQIIAGTQDNGSIRFTPNEGWQKAVGGDGQDVVVQVHSDAGRHESRQIFLTNLPGGTVMLTLGGIPNFLGEEDGFENPPDGDFQFIHPLALNIADHNRLLLVGRHLDQSVVPVLKYGIYESMTRGETWAEIATLDSLDFVSSDAEAVAQNALAYGGTGGGSGDPKNALYLGLDDKIYVRKTLAGGVVLAVGQPADGAIRDIVMDPDDVERAWAITDGGGVFFTGDFGDNWTDVSGSLSDVIPAAQILPGDDFVLRSMVIIPDVVFGGTDLGQPVSIVSDVLVLGSDHGVHYASIKANGTLGTWQDLKTEGSTDIEIGPAKVMDLDYSRVYDSKADPGQADSGASLLVAGTLGRGAYQLKLPGIDGKVFDDKNGNGIQGKRDFGIEDVFVSLYEDGQNPALAIPLATTRTDSTGHYSFTILNDEPTMSYFIEVSSAGGRAFSALGQGADPLIDSDVSDVEFPGHYISPSFLPSLATPAADFDAGVVVKGIGGRLLMEGAIDLDEIGVPDNVVHLYRDSSSFGTPTPGPVGDNTVMAGYDQWVATAFTDANGDYFFFKEGQLGTDGPSAGDMELAAGDYFIQVVANGFVDDTGSGFAAGPDSAVTHIDGMSEVFTFGTTSKLDVDVILRSPVEAIRRQLLQALQAIVDAVTSATLSPGTTLETGVPSAVVEAFGSIPGLPVDDIVRAAEDLSNLVSTIENRLFDLPVLVGAPSAPATILQEVNFVIQVGGSPPIPITLAVSGGTLTSLDLAFAIPELAGLVDAAILGDGSIELTGINDDADPTLIVSTLRVVADNDMPSLNEGQLTNAIDLTIDVTRLASTDEFGSETTETTPYQIEVLAGPSGVNLAPSAQDNANIQDLADDLNLALLRAGLSDVLALVDSQNKIVFSAIEAGVRGIDLTPSASATALGFTFTYSATEDAGAALLKLPTGEATGALRYDSVVTMLEQFQVAIGMPPTTVLYDEAAGAYLFDIELDHVFADLSIDLDFFEDGIDLGPLGRLEVAASADASLLLDAQFRLQMGLSVAASSGSVVLNSNTALSSLNGGQGVQLLVGMTAPMMPDASAGRISGDYSFEIEILTDAGLTSTGVLTLLEAIDPTDSGLPHTGDNFAQYEFDLDSLVGDINRAIAQAGYGDVVKAGIYQVVVNDVVTEERLRLIAVDTSVRALTFKESGSPDTPDALGFTNNQPSAYPDLEIAVTTGATTVPYLVVLDGSTTVLDVITKIESAAPVRVTPNAGGTLDIFLLVGDTLSVSEGMTVLVTHDGTETMLRSSAGSDLGVLGAPATSATTEPALMSDPRVSRGSSLTSGPPGDRLFIIVDPLAPEPSLTLTAEATGDFNLSAALGPIGLNLGTPGADPYFKIEAGVTLVDPNRDGRITLTELLASPEKLVDGSSISLDLEGAGTFAVTADIFGSDDFLDTAVGNQIVELSVSVVDGEFDFSFNVGDIGAILSQFKDIGIETLLIPIRGFLDELVDNPDLPFLNAELPLVNVSVNDAVEFVDGLVSALESIASFVDVDALRGALDDLETAVTNLAAPIIDLAVPIDREDLYETIAELRRALGGDPARLAGRLLSGAVHLGKEIQLFIDANTGIIGLDDLQPVFDLLKDLLPSLNTLESKLNAAVSEKLTVLLNLPTTFALDVVDYDGVASTKDPAVVVGLTLLPSTTYEFMPDLPLAKDFGPFELSGQGKVNLDLAGSIALGFGTLLSDPGSPFVLVDVPDPMVMGESGLEANVNLAANLTVTSLSLDVGFFAEIMADVRFAGLDIVSATGHLSLSSGVFEDFPDPTLTTQPLSGIPLNGDERFVVVAVTDGQGDVTILKQDEFEIDLSGSPTLLIPSYDVSGAIRVTAEYLTAEPEFSPNANLSVGFTDVGDATPGLGAVFLGDFLADLKALTLDTQGLIIGDVDPSFFGNKVNDAITFVTSLQHVTSPRVDVDKEALASLFDDIDFDLRTIVAGIGALLDKIEEGLTSEVVEKLPLIGDGLDTAGTFVGKLRDTLVTPFEKFLDTVGGSFEQVETAIEGFLVERLGGADGVLKGLDADAVKVTIDKDHFQVELSLAGGDKVEVDFESGFDALPIEAAGGLEVGWSYDFNLGFGMDREEGFYFLAEEGPEISLELFAELAVHQNAGVFTPTSIEVDLFGLTLTATDNNNGKNSGTGFKGMLALDLINTHGVDTDHPERLLMRDIRDLGFSEFFVATFDAGLNVDLHLEAAIGSTLPSIVVDLVASAGIHLELVDGKFDVELQALTVGLEDLGIDLGDFLSKQIGPVIDKIKPFIEPIIPVIDALKATVPGVSELSEAAGKGEVTFLDLAFRDDRKRAESAKKFVDIIDGIAGVVTSLGAAAGESVIFKLADDVLLVDPSGAPMTTPKPEGIDPNDPEASESKLGALLHKLEDLGIELHFLDAGEVINMLTGQDFTVATWDLPRFDISLGWGIGFRVIPVPPIKVEIDLGLSAFADISIGFDSHGIKTGNFVDGFFFGDLENVDQGFDIPEFGLSASISLAALLDIGFASAGVKGTLQGNLLANWRDPDGDGRVHLDEMAQIVEQDGVSCLFDLTGELRVLVSVVWSIFGAEGSKEFIDKQIAEFSNHCPRIDLAHVAKASDNLALLGEPATAAEGTLILHAGAFSSLRRSGSTSDVRDEFTITELANGVYNVEAFGLEQRYGGVESIYFDGGNHNDKLILNGVTVQVVALGRSGDDELQGGTLGDYIDGGSGSDTIFAGEGDNTLFGGDGADTIDSGSGVDAIYAGSGDDLITSGGGVDTVYGGSGSDEIWAGDGSDFVYGESGHDRIYGGLGDDIIDAGSGRDVAFGEDGNDQLEGGSGVDLLVGGTDDGTGDILLGNAGHDLLIGGDPLDGAAGEIDPSNNPLNFLLHSSGFHGNFAFYADATAFLADLAAHVSAGGSDGDDDLRGGDGNDFLLGRDGADILLGGWGNDLIVAHQVGDPSALTTDTIEGGPDDDFICATDAASDGSPGAAAIIGGTGIMSFAEVMGANPGAALLGGFAAVSCVEAPTYAPPPPATISGVKFRDKNGDQVFDEGEDGLEGFVIEFYDIDGELVETQTTDSDGAYTFSNLEPGQYTIAESQQEGFNQTFPVDSDHTVLVDGGDNVEDIDFGNFDGDYVFHFFRFFGDVLGDRSVDVADSTAFQNAFLTQSVDPEYRNYLDYERDGDIDHADLFHFSENFAEQQLNEPPGLVQNGDPIVAGDPPVVVAPVFDPNTGPHELSVSFDRNVNIAFDDLVLINLSTETTIELLDTPDDGFDYSFNSGTGLWTATWKFPHLFAANLPDGNYRAKLVVAGITDASTGETLRGNEGVPPNIPFSGSVAAETTALLPSGTSAATSAPEPLIADCGNFVFDTYRYFGDTTGVFPSMIPDRSVDNDDSAVFQAAYLATQGVDANYDARLDYELDGDVDHADLFRFSENYGTTLAAEPDLGLSQLPAGPGIPTITQIVFDQNIVPHVIDVTFSEDVSAAAGGTLDVLALRLENLTTLQVIDTADMQLSYNQSTNVASWSFVGPGVPNGLLEDGNYRITISGADVMDSEGNRLVGNVPLSGEISGVKWDDTNADGVQDPGEPLLSGWTIFLDTNQNGILDGGERSELTDTLGAYSFTGLAAATYHVTEVIQPGWTQSEPGGPSAIDVVFDCGVVGGIDFGNFLPIFLDDGDDIIHALGGDDVVYGDNLIPDPRYVTEGGDDTLYGGDGEDELYGQEADDQLLGGYEANSSIFDLLDGGAGTDTARAAEDATMTLDSVLETLVVGNETDNLVSIELGWLTTTGDGGNTLSAVDFSGSVRLEGGLGTNILLGGSEADVLVAGDGVNTLEGGDGDDLYLFTQGSVTTGMTTVVELAASGIDHLDFGADAMGVTVNLQLETLQALQGGFLTIDDGDTLENITGGTAADTLTGNMQANVIIGGAGDDTVTGGLGNDLFVFSPGDGDDQLTADAGGIDTVDYRSFASDLRFDVLNAVSTEVWESDGMVIPTLTRISQLGTGIERFLSGSGDDSFDFKSDGALLSGGMGEIEAGAGIDWLRYNGYVTFPATVDLSSDFATGTASVLGIENVEGGAANDSLTGDGGSNELIGLGGDDLLDGGAGADLLDGGAGDDKLYSGLGDDILRFDSAVGTESDEIENPGGDDTLDFSAVTDNLDIDLSVHAGSLDDGVMSSRSLDATTITTATSIFRTLLAGSGADILTDDPLNPNFLAGGDGDDRYVFATGPSDDTIQELATEDGEMRGTDTLDFSGVSGNLVVDLTNNTLANPGRSILAAPGTQPLSFENVIGGTGADQITGNAADNHLEGGDGDDTLLGLEGADILDPGTVGPGGSEVLEGGSGNDRYVLRSDEGWTVVENLGEVGSGFASDGGVDTLDFRLTTTTVSGNLTYTILGTSAIENIYGSASLENILTGDDGNNILWGGSQNDTLLGGFGSDFLVGFDGDDTLSGYDGTLTANPDTDNHDILVGGDGDDALNGFDGRDLLIGGNGLDTFNDLLGIEAGAGEDIIISGTTSYDDVRILVNGIPENEQSLLDIRLEWISQLRSYDERIAALRAGVGSSNTTRLEGNKTGLDPTVFDDAVPVSETLIGGDGLDWFFRGDDVGSPVDTVMTPDPAEAIELLDNTLPLAAEGGSQSALASSATDQSPSLAGVVERVVGRDEVATRQPQSLAWLDRLIAGRFIAPRVIDTTPERNRDRLKEHKEHEVREERERQRSPISDSLFAPLLRSEEPSAFCEYRGETRLKVILRERLTEGPMKWSRGFLDYPLPRNSATTVLTHERSEEI